jgi:hypothetical protein
MEAETGWAGLVRRRHIGDFRGWKEHDAYQEGFARLLRDLEAVGSTAKGSDNHWGSYGVDPITAPLLLTGRGTPLGWIHQPVVRR